MSLGNDYLQLVNLMWEIEEIDMWLPTNHVNLAYTMDKLVGQEEYSKVYANWLELAVQKDFNELCWQVREYTYRYVFEDIRFSEDDKKCWRNLYERSKKEYNQKKLDRIIVLGMGDEKYAPYWFLDFYNSYMPLKEVERDNAIKDYCQKECELRKEQAEEAFVKISRWYDIHNEFYFFVKNGRLKKWSPVTVETISAEEIVNTTGLNPLEAYLFLFELRKLQMEGSEDIALKKLVSLQSKTIIK